jgi:hypothetical protein
MREREVPELDLVALAEEIFKERFHCMLLPVGSSPLYRFFPGSARLFLAG